MAGDSRSINVRDYGAVGDGVTDDTAAFRSAAAAMTTGSRLFIPSCASDRGYLVTDTVTISAQFCHVVGEGNGSRIKFNPETDDKACIEFLNVGPSFYSLGLIEKIYIDSLSSPSVKGKAAIKLWDISHFVVRDVVINDFTSAARDAIGLHVLGKEALLVDALYIDADQPIRLSQGRLIPNSPNADHFSFRNVYLVGPSAKAGAQLVGIGSGTRNIRSGNVQAGAPPLILVDSDVVILNMSWSGVQAWTGGGHGFYWAAADTVVDNSMCIRFENVRTEQGCDVGAYSFYLAPTAGKLQEVSWVNCRLDAHRKGIYLRGVRRALIESSSYGSLSGEALNVDDTVWQLALNNAYFPGGSTATGLGGSKGEMTLVADIYRHDRSSPAPVVGLYGNPFIASSPYMSSLRELHVDRLKLSRIAGSDLSANGKTVYEVNDTSIPRTVTIPTSDVSRDSAIFIVKDSSGGAGTNPITVRTPSGTIDGARSIMIACDYGSVILYSDGKDLHIIGRA